MTPGEPVALGDRVEVKISIQVNDLEPTPSQVARGQVTQLNSEGIVVTLVGGLAGLPVEIPRAVVPFVVRKVKPGT